jgi:hypothetical protein
LPWFAFFFVRSLRLTVRFDMGAKVRRTPGARTDGPEPSRWHRYRGNEFVPGAALAIDVETLFHMVG